METFVGLRPDGLEVCHNDGVHTNNQLTNLRYDTRRENLRDRVRHGTFRNGRSERTHCPKGHEYDAANTRVTRGQRFCRACNREWSRLRRLRLRESVG